MGRMFAVSISTTAMVWADSPEQALQITQENTRQIVADTGNKMTTEILKDGVQARDLGDFGWDDQCIPYGVDGNTRISSLLQTASTPGGQN